MDNQAVDFASLQNPEYEEFQPEWDWHLPEYYEDSAAIIAAVEVGARVGRAVVDGLLWCRKYVGSGNPLFEAYVDRPSDRPADIHGDEEITANANPIPIRVLAQAAEGLIPDAEQAHTIRSTTFQTHWAAMVRAEFCGYWGTRTEQLCAARWLRQQFEAINVRKAHIATAIPIILVLALVPTADEDTAYALSRSEEFMAAAGQLSWPRRLWRWARGRKTIAARYTHFTNVK